MPNVFVLLSGAPTDVSAMGNEKTVVVAGVVSGAVQLEASNNGVNFDSVDSFTSQGVRQYDLSCTHMRFTGGGAVVGVGSEAELTSALALAVPPGDGDGVSSDASLMGQDKNIIVAGAFTGSLAIQVSDDNVNFATVKTLTGPESFAQTLAVNYMRISRSGNSTGTPVVAVAGSFDEGSVASVAPTDAAGFGISIGVRVPFPAGGGGVADDVPIVFPAPFSFRILVSAVYVASAGLAGSTGQLRDAPGGGGTALSDAWPLDTTGFKGNAALSATPVVLAGSVVFLRRDLVPDNSAAGEVIMLIQKL
jgi:hypothetical protein